MPDNLNDVGPQDGKLIALQQPHEVAYWTKALGVTEEELRAAVETVGHSALQVRTYLAHIGVSNDEAETLAFDQLTPGEKASLDEP